MKKKRNLIIVFSMLFIFAVAATFAYFSGGYNFLTGFGAETFNKTITRLFVSPDHWKPGDITRNQLSVTNDSNVDVVIRMKVTENWESDNGDIISNYDDDHKMTYVDYVNRNDWAYVDGYYYYNEVIGTNESTSDFIDEVMFSTYAKTDSTCTENQDGSSITCISSGDGYDNAKYIINFDIEMTPYSNYKKIWNTDYEIGSYNTFAQYLIDISNSASISDYSTGKISEPYTFSHGATAQTPALNDYRYIGPYPNNYIYFNCTDISDTSTCEVWRIIGVFYTENNTGQLYPMVKIVRNDIIDDVLFPYENVQWQDSQILAYLNSGAFWNGLTDYSKNIVADAKFYYGANCGSGISCPDGSKYSSENSYKAERGTTSSYDIYGYSKFSLLYPSDYGLTFSLGVKNGCFHNFNRDNGFCNDSSYIENDFTCGIEGSKRSWLYLDTDKSYWVGSHRVSPNKYYYGLGIDQYNNGLVGPRLLSTSSGSYGVRPVAYLRTGTYMLSGDGSEKYPYLVDIDVYSITNTNNLVTVSNSEFPSENVVLEADEHYIINSFKLNGNVINGNSFIMPNDDVVITDIALQQVKYDISCSNNSVDVPTISYVGDPITIEPTSDQYYVNSFKINGELVHGNTFIMPNSDVEITEVELKPLYYNIVNTDTDVSVANNARINTTVELTSDYYKIISFKVNGVLVNGSSFTMPEEDVEITDITKEELIVVETSHYPYQTVSGYELLYENQFEGATSITIDVKYQFYYAGSIYISNRPNSSTWNSNYSPDYTIQRYGVSFTYDSTMHTDTYTYTGDYIRITLWTGNYTSNDYYGFKIIITPNYD